ncbi:hypothetical protein [Caldalkalibacillus salinus]|uniref:hypothetical protein n=1 Tax=Caldalkalibacillus salinus TaxID=2803787 RepID=UPI0019219E46|nr:hypothetical protein [Caldalkalibacillus salinus]
MAKVLPKPKRIKAEFPVEASFEQSREAKREEPTPCPSRKESRPSSKSEEAKP